MHVRTLSFVLIFLAAALHVSGCSSPDAGVEYEGDDPGECADGADNDQDLLFDCDDPGCAGAKNCSWTESAEAYEGDEPGECADDADNDRDELFDCADPGCAGAEACSSVEDTAEHEEDDPGACTGDPSEEACSDTNSGETHDPGDVPGNPEGPQADSSDDVEMVGDCLTEEAYFKCAVWESFMGTTCYGCHQPAGPGSEASEFELLPVEQGDLGPNLDRVRAIAQKIHEGESVLLLKPRGDLSHGGGTILPEGSDEYNNLAALISYFENPAFCSPSCDGSVEPTEAPEETCAAPPVTEQMDPEQMAGAPPIYTQRLTHWQYRSSVKYAFEKYFNDIGDFLPPDSTTGAIPSNENYDLPTADYVRYAKAAAHVAVEIMAQDEEKLDALFACPGARNRSCAKAFIKARGARLFRRPLSNAEANAFLEIYDVGAQGAFEEGIQFVMEALLQAPDFLYQVELSPADASGEVRLSGLEIATRLAFFLHAQPPSQELVDAAVAGELDDDAGVEAWVDVLLADVGRARFGIQQFIVRWLRLDDDEAVEKDEALYPDFTSAVRHGLRRGAQLWAAYTVLEGDGQLETLFSAAETVVRLNGSENEFWETTEADVIATSDKFGTVVALPPDQRAGLLTSPLRLANAHNSDHEGTRPILRGASIVKNVLCGTLVPPQAFEPPGAVEGASVKDSVSFMMTSPGCAGCHEVINPLGLAFEIYDGVGRYREDQLDDLGFPIEPHGSFGVDGICSEETQPFDDAIDLVKTLATNEQLRTCATIQWFRYGLRRGPRFDGSDAGNLAEIYAAFADSDFNVPALLKAVALSRPFLYRSFAEAGDEP